MKGSYNYAISYVQASSEVVSKIESYCRQGLIVHCGTTSCHMAPRKYTANVLGALK